MTCQGIKRIGTLLGLLLWSAAHAGTVTYVYSDPQGTPLAEADARGTITATFDYRPYGGQALGAAPNGPGYTGHVNDPETGFVYMQARYYDPSTGRFLSTDPIKPVSGDLFNLNRYDYASNNPIVNTDPSGEATCADKACKYSRIDSRPAGSNGLTITFINDNPHGKSPDQPVTTPTAKMVEHAVIASGVKSVNINSTTGGGHAPSSRHFQKKAVDINSVDGKSVSSQGDSSAVQALQNAFQAEPNSRENFGPAMMKKTLVPGGKAQPFTNKNTAAHHRNHIHESGQY